MTNPTTSRVVNFSSRNNQAIKADVGGIKKKIDTVLLAEFLFNKKHQYCKRTK